MVTLKNYMNDGAHPSARAVLALLSWFEIEESWDSERNEYLAEVAVNRWHNCREQGYVLSLRSKHYGRQLNIAFFEHRNSDSIHAIKWEQLTLNPPTIDTADFGDVYETKWDTSFSVNYNQHYDMSKWIREQLTDFWIETCNEKLKLNI